MTILLAGAAGLVGGALALLLPHEDVHLISRRDSGLSLVETIAPPEDWPAAIARLRPTTAVSTLGSTIQKSGSKEAFRAVDHDLVVSLAAAAKEAGARHFIMVSSVGASQGSRNFYLKTKGEAEESVKALGFTRFDILRPGLLRGDRAGPTRWGERAAAMVSPLTDLLTPEVLSQYRSIEALLVARAIAALIGATVGGVHIHHNREMLALARAIG